MKRITVIAICAIAILGLVGWRFLTKTEANKALQTQSTRQKQAPTIVQTVAAAPRDIASSVEAVGTIESPFQVKLSPNVSGRIDYLQAREGDTVHAGDILVRINPQFVEGQILQAQSVVAEAWQKLAQARITQKANAVGINSAVSQQDAGVASARADYQETVDNSAKLVGAAHEAAVDAEAKVASAKSAVSSTEANVNLAKANLENAQAKYTREDNLYKQGFVAAQDLDDAKAAAKVNSATVTFQEKNLDAAKSALDSAQALFRSAHDQEEVVRKQQSSLIADTKAKLTQARKLLETASANTAQIPAYTENLKALYSEVVTAKAALKQAIAQRDYLIVKSPITGTVTQRLFDPGAEATPGSPVLVVQALDQLFMTSALPVEDADLIRPGMPLTITLDSSKSRTIYSKITDINKSADPTSRQFMVRAKLDNKDGSLRPGMFCTIRTVTSFVKANIAVPREAVKTDASNNSTVTTVDKDGIAHLTPVTLGVQDPAYVQILSGISAGDRVIRLSYRPVKDQSKVAEGTWNIGGSAGKGGAAGRSGAGRRATGSRSGMAQGAN